MTIKSRKSPQMNLYTKIFISALIPLIIVIGISMLQIEHFIDVQIQNHYQTENEHKKLIKDRFSQKLKNIYKDMNIISSSYEIIDAIKSNDNEILTVWSQNFLNKKNMIFFTDLKGVVLARAHDEFNFGDSLNKNRCFSKLKSNGSCHLITLIDNKLSYIIGKKIIQYERPIGYLIFALKLDKKLLHSLEKGTVFSLTIKDTTNINNNLDKLSFIKYKSKINENIENTLSLKKSLFYSLTFLIIFLATILYLTMKRHLKPYLKLTQTLSDFSENKISLTKLRINSKYFAKTNKNHEMQKVANAVYKMSRQVQKDQKHLEKLSQVDQLTQVFNRRRIEDIYGNIFKEAKRYDTTFSIVLLDIDHFKNVNDTFGHLFGDFVLKEVSKTLKRNIRETDYLGRYGGEEFIIISTHTNREAAMHLAEKLRVAISKIKLDKATITASFGFIEYDKEFKNKEEMFDLADKKLYNAKNNGRNTVRG